MDSDIIKRVVRAIADGSQNDLERLAGKIVETERRIGHTKLADQLDAINQLTGCRATTQSWNRTTILWRSARARPGGSPSATTM